MEGENARGVAVVQLSGHSIAQDPRFAIRSIWRGKLFALTALVAFSFGICATVFGVTDAVLLRPTTFPNPGSVVVLQASQKNRQWDNLAPWVFDRIRSRAGLFSGRDRNHGSIPSLSLTA